MPRIKPGPGTAIAWGHPLARGLKVCLLLDSGAGNPFERAARQTLTLGAQGTWVATPYGPGLSANGVNQTGEAASIAAPAQSGGGSPLTLFTLSRATTGNNGSIRPALGLRNNTSGHFFALGWSGTTGIPT